MDSRINSRMNSVISGVFSSLCCGCGGWFWAATLAFWPQLRLIVCPIKFLKGFGALGLPVTDSVAMEPIRILIFRQVLTLLFMSVTLDVPLPPPFSGRLGWKWRCQANGSTYLKYIRIRTKNKEGIKHLTLQIYNVPTLKHLIFPVEDSRPNR